MVYTLKNVVFGEGQPKICLPITGVTAEDVIAQAALAQSSKCQVVEWRVDLFEYTELDNLIETLSHVRTALRNKLLLFTFRTPKEGGKPQDFSLKSYQELYQKVAESGLVDLIDVELEVVEYLGRGFIQQLKSKNIGIIISYHNFQETPEYGELVLKVSMMKQFDADIGKIAVMPNSLKDVLRLMNVSSKLKGLVELPLILVSMGELGKISRVSGELIQSVMTFASLMEASAPGQIPVAQLVEMLPQFSITKSGSEDNG